jgi:DNA primase
LILSQEIEPSVPNDAHYCLLTTAVKVYHAALLANPRALTYAVGRGLDAETMREFRLRFAARRLKRYLALRLFARLVDEAVLALA